MLHQLYFLGLVVFVSLLLNALPLKGQGQAIGQGGLFESALNLEVKRNAGEVFSGLQQAGRDEAFAQALMRITGDAGDTYDALDAQHSFFYEGFRDALGDLHAATTDKGIKINRAAYEMRKRAGRSGPKAAPKRAGSKRTYGKSVNEFISQMAGGDTQISKIETETSTGGSADNVKVIESPEATTTKTQKVDTITSYNEKDMSMTTSTKAAQTSEAVSKTGKGKATKVSNMEWSTTFGWCPDGEGLVRGKARARIFNQTTINTGKQLAAGTTEYLLEFHITGQVNDDAEMPDFDMEGVVSEKITGFAGPSQSRPKTRQVSPPRSTH